MRRAAWPRRSLRTRSAGPANASGPIATGTSAAGVEPKPLHERGEEFRFKRAHRDIFAIEAAIGPVEGHAAIEDILSPGAAPKAAAL